MATYMAHNAPGQFGQPVIGVDLDLSAGEQSDWHVASEEEIATYEAFWSDRENVPDDPQFRLECLRAEIRAERISYGELAELQSLARYIEDGDIELLQWAGVPEFPEDNDKEDN